MRRRASPSGFALSNNDAAVVKSMLARGDRQHDIAAWFGVNGGRIAEIATGARFSWVRPSTHELPPAGPHLCGRDAHAAVNALSAAKEALAVAERVVQGYRNPR